MRLVSIPKSLKYLKVHSLEPWSYTKVEKSNILNGTHDEISQANRNVR